MNRHVMFLETFCEGFGRCFNHSENAARAFGKFNSAAADGKNSVISARNNNKLLKLLALKSSGTRA